MSDWGLGYRIEDEDSAYLLETSTPILFSAAAGSLPESVSFRSKGLRIEHQGRFGACVGNAGSTCLEICNYIDTSTWIQLSRWWCYIAAQRATGMNGRDAGATISGMAQAAKERGVCLESTYKYPSVYVDNLPVNAANEAKEHRIKAYAKMTDVQSVRHFIGSGLGSVILGMPWMSVIANSTTGEMSERTFTGRNLGGHCLCVTGYHSNGDLEIANSHSTQWGDKGWGRMTEGLARRLIQQGEWYGMSDLQEFTQPRTFGGMA